MARPGGIIEFDDYYWTIAKSPTVNPTANPDVLNFFTEEQIREAQVNSHTKFSTYRRRVNFHAALYI
jgi:hypothetical protein